MNNISIIGSSCVGCASCATTCKCGAISMITDDSGFLKPLVDVALCVSCGKCLRSCPVEMPHIKREPLEVLIAKSVHEDSRKSSPSGAVFTELAEYAIQKGWIAYGAAWNDDLSVSHKRASTLLELERIRGSKYVQSNLTGIWKCLKKDIDDGRRVLFSGTPCQVAAVYSQLGCNCPNLISVAIMCHSVTAPDTWKWYLDDLSARVGSKVVSANFRDKRDGLNGHLMSVSFDDAQKNIVTPLDDNPYAKVFFNLLNTRTSCFSCKFKGNSCGADLIVGDFWGGARYHPSFDDGHGVNAILVLTEKGKDFVKAVKGVAHELSTYDKVLERNPLIERSVKPNVIPAQRFRAVYRKIPFDKAVTYAINGSLAYRLLHKFKTALGMLLKALGR